MHFVLFTRCFSPHTLIHNNLNFLFSKSETVTFNYINLIFKSYDMYVRKKFSLKTCEINPKKHCQQVSGGDTAPLFYSHEIPPEILEYCIQFGGAQHKEDIHLLE